LYKYKNSLAQGGKDERDKKVLISQGLAAMNVAEDTATEKQKKEALEMDDVGVICPCCGGIGVMRILKPEGKASSGRVTMSIAERLPNRPPGGFARGGDDYDENIRRAMAMSLIDAQGSSGQGAAAAARGGDDYDENIRRAMAMSLIDAQGSSGQGAVVMGRPQAAAAAAAAEEDDPDIVAALLASSEVTHTPIEIIYTTLHDNGIYVSEDEVRAEFQTFSRQYPGTTTDEAIRQIISMFKWPRVERVINRVREELRELAADPVSEDRLRSEVQRILQREFDENTAVSLVVQNLTPNFSAGGRGKKSKMTKSRRGKKSKMSKSRRGKKSKMTTTRQTRQRRGKKSKMTITRRRRN
jgi:hypothetical protein